MLFILSPAKSLDFTPVPEAPASAPRFGKESRELSRAARKLTGADIRRLMGISDKLADLNRARFKALGKGGEEAVQAVFAFDGDVYHGLQGRTLDAEGLTWAQDHLRILSGLYGVLRPLDRIEPYRLEMGIRLPNKRGASLYEYWGDALARRLNVDSRGQADRTIVNLASQEYFHGVDRRALKLPVVACRFLDVQDGEARLVSFYAKTARGMMARWAIDHRAERIDDLKGFDGGGYAHDAALSTPDELTFTRPHP